MAQGEKLKDSVVISTRIGHDSPAPQPVKLPVCLYAAPQAGMG